MSNNSKAVATQDFDAVVAAVQRYVDGMQTGDPKTTAKAFHDDAVMYGFAGGTLLGGPISNLYDYVEKSGKAPNMRTRIDVLAITPTTAVARVDMENDANGADYTDFHTLIKQDGQWKVIAKLFHQHT
ncbi:nuclear transport factor 2 family protein [Methylobacterium sp. CM6246]